MEEHDCIIIAVTILHPETQTPIVKEGEWLNRNDCIQLFEEYGVDEITGHVVHWPK
jgi:hypothetical protein